MELDDNIHKQIIDYCAKGDQLLEKSKFEEALIQFDAALELVPAPRSTWEASVWIYTAIGDTYFYKKEYQKSVDAFYDAYNGPGAIDNPFINLRLGQCLFELSKFEKAEDFLLRAYMLDGVDVFDSEAPKYIKHMRAKYDL